MSGSAFTVRTIHLDLPALAGAFSRRLHDAGVPMTAERAARFAEALALVKPLSRRRLYWTARAVLVSDSAQVKAFDSVFSSVFGALELPPDFEPDELQTVLPRPDERPAPEHRTVAKSSGATGLRAADFSPAPSGMREEDDGGEIAVPVAPSDEEVLRGKRFDALAPEELAQLYRLMGRLEVATPRRRTRRSERHRRGERMDMRRTLRGSMRTAGDPIRLARRRRRVVRRRMVMLCDISGSMEPYARAYLQFLTCAAGSGPNAEAFVFATRLTRLTRALRSRSPERAIQRAAAAAPDWSSGTRIGDALKAFNDRHGRQGHGSRRNRRDPVGRLGAGRSRPRGARDGAALAPGPSHRVGEPARGRGRLLAAGRRHGGGPTSLRRARERPQPGRTGRGGAGDRSRPLDLSGTRLGARRGVVGKRHSAPRQLRRDAERIRAGPRQDDAGLGA